MHTMTHKVGLRLQISDPADERDQLKNRICRLKGVIHAEFSKEYPDIVVIEYNPSVTNTNLIYQNVEKIAARIQGKVFL